MDTPSAIKNLLDRKALKTNPLETLQALLKPVAKGTKSHIAFPKALKPVLKSLGIASRLGLKPQVKVRPAVAKFALLLIEGNNYGYYYTPEASELLRELCDYPDHHDNRNDDADTNIWQSEDFQAIILLIYGSERYPLLQSAWEKMPQRMYQTGWERRSFRAPQRAYRLHDARFELLRDSLPTAADHHAREPRYYALSLAESLQLEHHIAVSVHPYVWAELIDAGDAAFLALCEDIAYNRDEIGQVSQGLIKALLASESPTAWKIVEDLLLATQRQEGLRQTIIECLDEASIGAIPHFIRLILAHKLTRFSAIVRGVDVWVGMGWDAAKESLIKQALTHALGFFDAPETIAKGVQSRNNMEIMMALWVQGCLDIDQTVPHLERLLNDSTTEKQCLALYFAGQIGIRSIEIPLYRQALSSDNPQVLAFALPRLNVLIWQSLPSPREADLREWLFTRCDTLAAELPEKEQRFTGKVFAWTDQKFSKADLYQIMIKVIGDDDVDKLRHLISLSDDMPIEARESLARELLKPFFGYSYAYQEEDDSRNKPTALTPLQREAALALITDRGEMIHTAAERALSNCQLTVDEQEQLSDLLQKGGAGLQKRLVSILLQQPEKALLPLTDTLIASSNTNQRLAALEIVWQLDNNAQHPERIKQWLADYRQRDKFTKAETQRLARFEDREDGVQINTLSEENGWGLYDPTILSDYQAPILDKQSPTAISLQQHPYGLSKPLSAIKKDITDLYQRYLDNQNHEYEIDWGNGSRETVLLGNQLPPTYSYRLNDTDDEADTLTPRERFERYPLWEVWQQWYEQAGWQPQDLLITTLTYAHNNQQWPQLLSKHIFYGYEHFPTTEDLHRWNNPLINLLQALSAAFPMEVKDQQAYLLAACQQLFTQLPRKVLQYQRKPQQDYYYNTCDGDGWQSDGDLMVFLEAINIGALDEAQFRDYWNLQRWQQHSGLPKNINTSQPPLHAYARAYEHQLISRDEMIAGILLNNNAIADIQGRSGRYAYNQHDKWLQHYPFLKALVHHIRDYCLDVELKRGEIETPVSQFVSRLQRIEGIDRLVSLVVGLGKKGFYANYIYGWGDKSKRELFSYLIKCCYPAEDETVADFDRAVTAAKLDEAKLVAIAMYAPQWQPMVSAHLGWEGLDSGIWWLRAHTKTADYQERSAEDESEIARFSTIELADFKIGAVDIEWFQRAYNMLGKHRWEMLYECAKYVSEGNGHRRAKLYADVLTNQLKIRAVTTKVKDKRDQDYVRLYGLVPLSKATPEKDLLTRYLYLQQFKKESRQFGSQRQTSEAQAVQVAMDNLARNAGYADPIRLSWAMESKTVQEIFANDTEVTLDDTTIALVIGEDGKADITVSKAGKTLKSVPAKYRKDKKLTELKAQKKVLVEQFRRSRQSLEAAMVRGDQFSPAELNELMAHPVIARHLEKLVFVHSISADKGEEIVTGFYRAGELSDANGKNLSLPETAALRIAHCTDLHVEQTWTSYQRLCFEQQLVQPFKQIFRELYLPTADELAQKTISRRYAGHQVQPKQTVALLKTRGWRVDYDEGMQKVYHQQGFSVRLYAMADWFSPADTESPTLETVSFEKLRGGEKLDFATINSRIFSEVMRDIDLVVSVAHVGGVDPEASQSSIEMRSVLLTESMRLFKQDNVTVSGNHALITGSLANYSVHLGSAVAHQKPGSYLSILPVHSQHRGRLFLPFMDDDPKTAELISKVLLLARDHQIQDPTVLRQINALGGT